jgi:hypothetical protein
MDETAGMTVQEKCDYLNNQARDFLSSGGADPLLVSFPDGGKLRPRWRTVEQKGIIPKGAPDFALRSWFTP